jgi:hypothetical protein
MSPGDRDRYQFWPHDDTLEQTADSQEKTAGDAAPRLISRSRRLLQGRR